MSFVEKIEIDAPPAKVWEIVGNFQDLSWHPAVAKTEGTGGNAVDAKRTITFKKGGSILETATKYDAEGKTLSYRMDKDEPAVVPVANYSSTISVKEEGGKSVVEWKGAFYRGFLNNDPPPELSDEAALRAVTDFYQTGLAALKAKAESK
jgi:carbon monoxide dehydrogenase subunit G